MYHVDSYFVYHVDSYFVYHVDSYFMYHVAGVLHAAAELYPCLSVLIVISPLALSRVVPLLHVLCCCSR